MADGINRVTVLGNLGADPELRMTGNGNAVLNMRLAVSESYLDRNKTRQERTEWVSCVMWGKRGEALSRFLSKGDRILVEGSLRTSSYDDKEGNKRYKTEVNATNVVLCGGRGGGERSAAKPERAQKGSVEEAYTDDDYGDGQDDGSIPF